MVDVTGLALQSIRQVFFEDIKAQRQQMAFVKSLMYISVGVLIALHVVYSSLYSYEVIEDVKSNTIDNALSLISVFYAFLSNTAILVAYLGVFFL